MPMDVELQEAQAEAVAVPNDMWRAFRHRNFSLFFWGQLVSMIGTWSQMLAYSWLVWKMTHSPVWLGVIGFTSQVPTLLLGLPGGALADRFDRLRSLSLMQTLCMLQAVLLGILTLSGVIELWHLVALSAVLGSVYAFEFPIRQAFVMDVVGKRDLLNATSLVAAMFHLTRMLGPTVAGAIVAWKGEGICFLFNAATFLALIGALAMVRRREMLPVARAEEPMGRSILAGLAHLRSVPEAKHGLFLIAILAGIGMQYTTLMPIFADQIFGGGAVQLGWMMGASGAGALAGGIWLARRSSSERLLSLAGATAVVFSAALTAFGLVPVFEISLGILVVMGFGLTVAFSSVGTFLQHRTPDHLRGRMMSLYTMTFLGLSPFGNLVAGGMARAIGAPLTVAITGAVCFVAGAWTVARSRKRRPKSI
jgi:MFS family permease